MSDEDTLLGSVQLTRLTASHQVSSNETIRTLGNALSTYSGMPSVSHEQAGERHTVSHPPEKKTRNTSVT